MTFSAVAWVPDDDPQRDWQTAAALAADWVEAQCAESGASAVLVTNALGDLGVPALHELERRHTRTSRLAGKDRVGPGEGPVLSYVPAPDDLRFAMDLARNSALAVVEGGLFPLAGWAAWFEAHDLVRGKPTPPLDDETRKAVERFEVYGNNAFGDPFGKQQARSILQRLQDQETLDSQVLLGAVLAAGVRPRGVKNLARLIGKL